ncbi:MAG: electron transport complex subunit RsxG [Cellvibrionaceae bacterium]
MRSSIRSNSILLGLFALVTAGVVATTQQATKDRIVESKLRAAQAALYEIIPPERHDNDLFLDTTPIPADFEEFLGLRGKALDQKQIHIARKEGEAFAAIIPTVALDGYSGPIEMIMGINADGTIAGIRVTSHKETPGLGDYIEVRKSNWILSFDGKTISSPFNEQQRVTRSSKQEGEFDQLTGATITRKAVIRQVKKTLSFFDIVKPLDGNTDE